MRDLILADRPRRRPTARADRSSPRIGSAARFSDRPRVIRQEIAPAAAPAGEGYDTDPYVDYGRYLTAQGGVLLIYKGVDDAPSHTLWRLFAWTSFTGFEIWIALARADIATDWIKWVCFAAAALVNAIIVGKAVEAYHRIEIKPDCMIIDGAEVFWERHMEAWPSFQQDMAERFALRGIYGTRFVEFLTVRRSDPFDRMPEIMAGDLKSAIQQLWSRTG